MQQLFTAHDPFPRKKNTVSVPFAKSLPLENENSVISAKLYSNVNLKLKVSRANFATMKKRIDKNCKNGRKSVAKVMLPK